MEDDGDYQDNKEIECDAARAANPILAPDPVNVQLRSDEFIARIIDTIDNNQVSPCWRKSVLRH
jgi:hypothetical protein